VTKTGDPAAIVAALRAAESFLVTTHANPDGDAIGSVLAAYHLLRALGKTAVTCVCNDPVPHPYQDLPGADLILGVPDDPLPVEAVVILDVARRDRLGEVADQIPPDATVIVIDHHLDDAPCGEVNFVDTSYAAAGEIVVELFAVAGVPLSREAAECAYVAQITDTGGYRFSNTNARSHRIAAALVEAGVDVAAVNRRIFDVMARPKLALLKKVLARQAFDAGGRVAYAQLTAQDIAEAGALGGDLDGLVNYLRNIEDVDVGILFREVDAKTTKVSVRSYGGFNAAVFLGQFDGGGHAAAAGATVAFPLDATRARVLDALTTALEQSP